MKGEIRDKIGRIVSESLAPVFMLYVDEEKIEEFLRSNTLVGQLDVDIFVIPRLKLTPKMWKNVGEAIKRELEEKGFDVTGSFERKGKQRVVKTRLLIRGELKKGEGATKVCVKFIIIYETKNNVNETRSIEACKKLEED